MVPGQVVHRLMGLFFYGFPLLSMPLLLHDFRQLSELIPYVLSFVYSLHVPALW